MVSWYLTQLLGILMTIISRHVHALVVSEDASTRVYEDDSEDASEYTSVIPQCIFRRISCIVGLILDYSAMRL